MLSVLVIQKMKKDLKYNIKSFLLNHVFITNDEKVELYNVCCISYIEMLIYP